MIRNQSGNVLFYVLIGVALMAGLAYAVSNTNRSSAESITTERAGIVASEIIEYGGIVGNAVTQLRLRGIDEIEISFENDVISGYENPNCGDDGCMVFALDGGGITYSAPLEEWLDRSYAAEPRYQELYFNGTAMGLDKGSDNKDDLILFIPYLKKSVCIAINNALGISPNTAVTPEENSGPFESGEKFTGLYPDNSDLYVSGSGTAGQSEILSTFNAGCTKSSGSGMAPAEGSYHFYKILLAR